MAFLNLQPQNYPQRQNLPTTINFDWLDKYNNLPQQQAQPLQAQPFLNLQYPRTDIDFLNLNKDGIKYSRDIDGTLSAVAGATATAETPTTPAVGQQKQEMCKSNYNNLHLQQHLKRKRNQFNQLHSKQSQQKVLAILYKTTKKPETH